MSIKNKTAREWYNEGRELLILGHYEAAINCFDSAIEQDPSFDSAYLSKCLALSSLGEHSSAVY